MGQNLITKSIIFKVDAFIISKFLKFFGMVKVFLIKNFSFLNFANNLFINCDLKSELMFFLKKKYMNNMSIEVKRGIANRYILYIIIIKLYY